MRTKTVLEYIGYGLFIIVMVVVFNGELRSKAIGLFKSKPYVELSDNTPYELNIKEFAWGYGVTAINQFNGDFDKLDEKVYDLLKGKTGICRVNLQSNRKDKYGQPDLTMQYIGDINIDELNKYQDWHYWQKDSGIRTLLYKRFVKPQPMDSVKTDSVRTEPVNPDTTKAVQNTNNSLTVQQNTDVFSFDDLYTTNEKPSTLEENRFVINGTIGEVYFDSGLFQIITTDGDRVVIHIYPPRASSATASRLHAAFQTGNTIRCVAERTSTTDYDLLAAKVTK